MKLIKQITSLVVAFSILLSVVGVTRYAHYCGDKLFSLTYFTKASCGCGDESTDMDGCCKTEVTTVQYNLDFIISQHVPIVKPEIITSAFTVSPFLFNTFNYTNTYFPLPIHKPKCDGHSPPLYLKNSAFLI
ncbi:MAG: HYC_CC_PP family protein [Bacteroidia bacterium]